MLPLSAYNMHIYIYIYIIYAMGIYKSLSPSLGMFAINLRRPVHCISDMHTHEILILNVLIIILNVEH